MLWSVRLLRSLVECRKTRRVKIGNAIFTATGVETRSLHRRQRASSRGLFATAAVGYWEQGGKHRRVTIGSAALLSPEQARKGWTDAAGKKFDGAEQLLAKAT
jgi:hypothetical protein